MAIYRFWGFSQFLVGWAAKKWRFLRADKEPATDDTTTFDLLCHGLRNQVQALEAARHYRSWMLHQNITRESKPSWKKQIRSNDSLNTTRQIPPLPPPPLPPRPLPPSPWMPTMLSSCGMPPSPPPPPPTPTPSCRWAANSWAPGCIPHKGLQCWPYQGGMFPSYEGPSRVSRCSRTGLRTSTRFCSEDGWCSTFKRYSDRNRTGSDRKLSWKMRRGETTNSVHTTDSNHVALLPNRGINGSLNPIPLINLVTRWDRLFQSGTSSFSLNSELNDFSATSAVWRRMEKVCRDLNILVCITKRYINVRRSFTLHRSLKGSG